MIGTIKIGHAEDEEALTGCTVFLAPEGTIGACEVRGGAPGTHNTQYLRPTFAVGRLDAILFTGGSLFGLAGVDGVTRFLEENGIGLPTGGGRVPLVSAAVIFDLDLGAPGHPDSEMARAACRSASVDDDREGCVGVGLGASVGNVLGRAQSTKGGFGLYRAESPGFRLEVAAVVNSFGDVVGEDGRVIAGARDAAGNYAGAERLVSDGDALKDLFGQNTTLVLVATNARLGRDECARLALQGHNGIARAIHPSHTRYDGDTVFALATGEVEAPLDSLEALAALGAAEAIRSAVLKATAAGTIPAARDLVGREP